MQDDWVDCYQCGKALHHGDCKLLPCCGLVHTDCYPGTPPPIKKLPRSELDNIIKNPIGWFEAEKKRRSPPSLKYLITFTWDSKVDKSKWKKRVAQQLLRKNVKEIYGIGLEHPDSNMHVHAYIEATTNLRKQYYKSFEKTSGFVDIKHIKVDHGVLEYISKENLIKLDDLK